MRRHPGRSVCGRRAAVVLALALGLARAGGAVAAEPLLGAKLPPELERMLSQSEELFAGMAQASEEQLARVVSLLRASARPGATWVTLLDGLAPEVRVEDLLGPVSVEDARAAIGAGGMPRVTLEQVMTFVLHDKAHAAARRFIHLELGIAPEKIDDRTQNLLKGEIERHALAWVIAHEIAHHRLGHVGRNPGTLARSREWERKADRLAWTMLNDAGFSMPLLERFFEVWDALDDIRRRHGLRLVPEELSTHPSWHTRLEELRAFMRTTPPAPGRWTMLLFAAQQADGTPLITRWLLPQGADDRVGFEIFDRPQSPGTPPFSWIGIERAAGSPETLYQRGDGGATACELEDPGGHYPVARCTIPAEDGTRSVTFTLVRISPAAWQVADRSGVLALVLGVIDARTIGRAALRAVTSDAAELEQADALVDRHYRGAQDVLFRLARGELAADTATAELETLNRRFDHSLQGILGSERARRYVVEIGDRIRKLVEAIPLPDGGGTPGAVTP